MYVKCLAYGPCLIHTDPLPSGAHSAHAPVPGDYTWSTLLLRELGEQCHLISALKCWLTLHLPSPSSQISAAVQFLIFTFHTLGGGNFKGGGSCRRIRLALIAGRQLGCQPRGATENSALMPFGNGAGAKRLESVREA